MKKDNTAINIVNAASSMLPTRYGNFKIIVFYDKIDHKEHIAVIKGDIKDKSNVTLRIHSECITGDAIGSLRCDCRDQLLTALKYLGFQKFGILLYLRQEGRGIGLINKIKAYHLQDNGLDTVEANHALGFEGDLRNYSIAGEILKFLRVKSVNILTNNPKKISDLEKGGIIVTKRTPLDTEPNIFNENYLKTKKKKLGHRIDFKTD
jgi:GTP cyclohydrolase II|tara:strand:+ start:943 stop:1563 length:621 start_codon:yes stop_codon:yes gene_type:complete